MAVTENTYTGDGSTVLRSFTFPYLETTDIKVSLDGVDTTAYTLANATTIQFNTAPANGVAIRIYRETDDNDLTATFYPGSAIRSQDLNENFNQALFIAQETKAITIQASTGNLVDGAITTAKLADEAVTTTKIGPSTVTTTKIQNGAVTAAKLAETYLTTTAAASTYLTSATAATTYLPLFTVTTTDTNRSIVNLERCTVTASGITITLPGSPQPGWEVTIAIAGTFTDTIIARNSANIMSLAENMTIDQGNVAVTLFYVDATRGWRII